MARFSTPTQNNERVKTELSRGRLWKVTVRCVSQNSLNQDGLSQNGYGGVYGVYGASAVVFFKINGAFGACCSAYGVSDIRGVCGVNGVSGVCCVCGAYGVSRVWRVCSVYGVSAVVDSLEPIWCLCCLKSLCCLHGVFGVLKCLWCPWCLCCGVCGVYGVSGV